MEMRKRKRLESKGWRIGSAADFLGMTSEEAVLVEIRLALSRALKERRRRTMTQTQLARKINSSQPRIAKAEGGDVSVSLDLLLRAMLATGATPRQIGNAIAGAATASLTRTGS